MKWVIDYSKDSKEDIRSIHRYIANELKSPITAKKLTNKILDAVDSLEDLPLRYPPLNIEPYLSQGFRRINVENYTVIYLPDENSKTVRIIRILYSRRDFESQLSD